jgi:hypothetical protein
MGINARYFSFEEFPIDGKVDEFIWLKILMSLVLL